MALRVFCVLWLKSCPTSTCTMAMFLFRSPLTVALQGTWLTHWQVHQCTYKAYHPGSPSGRRQLHPTCFLWNLNHINHGWQAVPFWVSRGRQPQRRYFGRSTIYGPKRHISTTGVAWSQIQWWIYHNITVGYYTILHHNQACLHVACTVTAYHTVARVVPRPGYTRCMWLPPWPVIYSRAALWH